MRRTIFIGIGGFLGAIARYSLRNISLFGYSDKFPVNTLLINVIGSFLLVYILAAIFKTAQFDNDLKAGMTTGFLGAFTTFSTFCRETVDLFAGGSYFTAFFYIGISMLAGLAAAWLGNFAAELQGSGKRTVNSFPEIENAANEMECGAE